MDGSVTRRVREEELVVAVPPPRALASLALGMVTGSVASRSASGEGTSRSSWALPVGETMVKLYICPFALEPYP